MPEPVITHLETGGLSTRIHTIAGGSDAAGPTFVLVPGIGMSPRYFRRLQVRLAETATVHAVELPGFGRNRRPRHHLTVEATADILAGAVEAVGARPCVVVGHSMGAQFGTELARWRPDLVSNLVLIGPVVDSGHPTAVQQTGRLIADTLREPMRINAIVFADYVRCGIRWYLDQLRPMLSYPIGDRIRSVSRPVLVLRGAKDPVAPEPWCRSLAAAAPVGSSASIPGGAHVIQESRPDAVAAAILAFAGTGAAVT